MPDERKTFSMGCQVERITCSICGKQSGEPCEHVRVIVDDYPVGVVSDFKVSDRPSERVYEMASGIGARGYEMSEGHSGVAGEITKLIAFSMVAAPRCESCQQPMTGVSGTRWCCSNKHCGQEGVPVETGVGMAMTRDLEADSG